MKGLFFENGTSFVAVMARGLMLALHLGSSPLVCSKEGPDPRP